MCVFDSMTNEEQELAVRLAYPLVYCTALSLHSVYVCACKPCDKLHIAHNFDVFARALTLSRMQREGSICA